MLTEVLGGLGDKANPNRSQRFLETQFKWKQ